MLVRRKKIYVYAKIWILREFAGHGMHSNVYIYLKYCLLYIFSYGHIVTYFVASIVLCTVWVNYIWLLDGLQKSRHIQANPISSATEQIWILTRWQLATENPKSEFPLGVGHAALTWRSLVKKTTVTSLNDKFYWWTAHNVYDIQVLDEKRNLSFWIKHFSTVSASVLQME